MFAIEFLLPHVFHTQGAKDDGRSYRRYVCPNDATAAHGDTSDSSYPSDEDGDFNSDAEKTKEIVGFEVSEECIYI